jgi:flagella basal body P-ring formation protein FlgA
MDFFSQELGRYQAKAEVLFDRQSDAILDLAGPTYEFRVRRRSGPLVGLVSVEVDVLSNGAVVQTVPLVARVSLVRRAVVARRTINQGATVASGDVAVVDHRYASMDQLALHDGGDVIGQRAKRLIPAGQSIGGEMLEAVPLVLRGQLVSVHSTVGGIRVVTSGKALEDGLRGEPVRVRSSGNERAEFDAVVNSPGVVEVRLGEKAAAEDLRETLLTMGSRP